MVTRDLNFGIGTHVKSLVEHLEALGVDVEIVVGKGNFRTNRIPKKFKKGEYDVIHVQGSCFGAFGKTDIPRVTTVHSLLKTEWRYEKRLIFAFGRTFEDKTLKKSDRIIAVSEILKDELARDYRIKDNVTVISNAVDVSEFNAYPDFERNPIFVFGCGRNVKRKDFDTLKKACKLSRIPLRIFHGEVSRNHMIEFYKKATVFVSSSLYETFGFTIAEAMACKCPVISSDIEAIKDLVIDGVTGLLFRRGDAEDLASKIKFLLWNWQLRERLAQNAYKRIKTTYNWEKVAKQTLQVYEEMVN